MTAPDVESLFSFTLSTWQVYGLFFLLGGLAIATLSDLRRLSAQREFLEIWILFAVLMLGLDLRQAAWNPGIAFALKWGLILAFSLLSWQRVGILFRLATADVAACAAIASLLAPGFVALFWVLLKLAALIEAPLLRRGRNVYPFLPVVSTATVLVLAVAWWAQPGLRQWIQ